MITMKIPSVFPLTNSKKNIRANPLEIRVNQGGQITDGELRKAKEYIKGRTALALEDTAAVNDFFGERALFHGSIETPEEVLEKIEKVTIGDVVRVAKDIFKKQKLNLAIIGPFKDKEKFSKILNG